ncbi:hypothetical protein BHM03_00051973 [Ensete ventricosum]|nr:hypothetical protein BHM03_00051973 [Ensete ventricosum]
MRRRGWPWLAARGNRLLATANPPCRGCRLQPRPPCKGATGHLQGAAARRGNSSQGATTRGHGRLRPAYRGGCQWRACKGRLPAASPQGPTASDQPARGYPRRAQKAPPPRGRPLARQMLNATRSATAYAGAVAATTA